MNEPTKVYLAGSITNIGLDKAIKRNKDFIRKCDFDICIVDTATLAKDYYDYQFQNNRVDVEKLAMDYDLKQLGTCDLVVVDLTDVNNSVGTIAEITYAYCNNISVLGYYRDGETVPNLHPWLKNMIMQEFRNENEVIDYLFRFY